ncbi:metal homeostatis BSD2 family protein [Aspergillus undulatus]|uniref:metal homeostatis BSD2 family protein n=1 Tax=Aspergillus undulatus TaxID=1810928 RepID=UPI003CCE22A0
MSSQRYQRVNAQDDDDIPPSIVLQPTPSSPPPSFRSHSRSASPSSRRLLRDDDPLHRQSTDQALADAFDDSESEAGDEPDDRQRLMRAQPDPWSAADNNNPSSQAETAGAASSSGGNSAAQADSNAPPTRGVQRSSTILPFFGGTSSSSSNRQLPSSNDGVFANLAAKPERGEKTEDLPPSYEEAAADATPPYWETTIVAPGISSDEVYVDGLPVGSIFSFVWNAMISMSFQLVGFLLTYLLHTTHAAKNGSRAGLGLTLVQYGFYMKGGSESGSSGDPDEHITPPDPNSHSFDPGNVVESGSSGGDGDGASAISTSEWISYVLMIVGWFILIRAISDFLRARRHEQLVLQSPERGLPVPVIAENERSETVV